MTFDPHALCRKSMDDTLINGLSPLGDPLLRQHLETCSSCQEYLDASRRVITSLGGFSFELDPSHQDTVHAALQLRAQQLAVVPLSRKQIAKASAIACVFAIIGSLLDLQFGGFAASLLHTHHLHLRQNLLTFWIIPSLFPLLLFPMLPFLAGEKEKTS